MKLILAAAAAFAAIQLWAGFSAGTHAIDAVDSRLNARTALLQRI